MNIILNLIFILELKTLVGSEDSDHARKTMPNSLNALYYTNQNKSIIVSQKKEISNKLMSYFFAGRYPYVTESNYLTILDPYV